MLLSEAGCELHQTSIASSARQRLREDLFQPGKAGARCLLDHPQVQEVVEQLRYELTTKGHLPPGSVAIQAIAFDKTAETNWKVTWHQDLMFPFAKPVTSPGFELSSMKDGIAFARPPKRILEALLAVRLHLDDCDEKNGPLRISPGTHLSGIIPVADVPELVRSHGQKVCLADEGIALLMRPLLLHASSKAIEPEHRRVLHLVFAPDELMTEEWHRRV